MKQQKKLVKWIFLFFIAMFIFTVLSRAADSLSVAIVDTKSMQNQVITHIVQGSGTVEGTREKALFVQAGQKIESVFVKEGQKVKEGEELLELSRESLQESLSKKKEEVAVLSRKIEDLKSADSIEKIKKDHAVSRAKENYNEVIKNGDINMANAQMEVDIAKQKLQDFYEEKAKMENQDFTLSDGTTEDLGSGEHSENLPQEQIGSKEQEQALQDEIRAKEEVLNQIVMARNKEVLTAEWEIQDSEIADGTDGSMENAEAELAFVQKEVAKLQALLDAGGKVKAASEGIVKRMSAAVGGQTTEEAAVVLYEIKGNLRITGEIDKEDLKYIEVGGKVRVKGSGEKEITDAVLESVSEVQEDENLRKISVLIPENTLEIGEKAQFFIEREEGPYDTCIPLSALREENGRKFVFVTEKKDTILGEILVARKMEVIVKDKNQSYAALEEGGLSSDQQIIIRTDREVGEGSRVRLQKG